MGFLKICLVICLTIVVVVENRRITKLERLENVLKRTNKILNDLRREVTISDETTCVDVATKCEEWKTRDGDQWEGNCQRVEYLQSNCKNTCNLCDGSGGSGGSVGSGESGGSSGSSECVDIRTDCEAKVEELGNQICNTQFWQDKCNKTCGCGEGSSGGTGGSTGSGGSGGSGCSNSEPAVLPEGVEECTEQNKGHCECAEGCFKTFVFTVQDQTRCFTVYRPEGLIQKLPVVLSSQCYGQDRLGSLLMKNTDNDENKAAGRYGFARFGLSSPDGAWTFGNNGVVNEENPMPCAESDSKDMAYVGKIFEFIDMNEELFNTNRIYAEGFSQNSMFSAYIGFCYSDRVTGIWQGGSGLALKSQENVNLPGMQSKCSASSYAEHKKDCEDVEPCTDCTYWPIYPCYESTKPMIDCIADYDNDNIANARAEIGNPEIESTAVNMYNFSTAEGHDARLLRFKASDDGTIPGGHKNPRNTVYWQMGCWGMTEKCSSECESSFEQCIDDENPTTAEERVEAFNGCIDKDTFKELPGCDSTCSPTFEMLSESEEPYKVKLAYNKFGANDLGPQPRPSSSMCRA